MNARDDELLALMIQTEVDTQPLAAKVAVAHALLNRAKRFDKDLEFIANQMDVVPGPVRRVSEVNLTIARLVVNGLTWDQMGALYFHDLSTSPAWANGMHFIGQVGSLFFYYED